ncbi:NAD(P)/FAD-dependent oxidoreductase [Nocardia sp. CA-107356]|uniref:NAD(P)/FAD-dependent oxidoreductase n=1 Tax=Nocardia sp. CA-107356 TaxID=3239972 RepID=UPI003D8CE197
MLEAARYPREKYCAGAVGGWGERILRKLDASPDVPSAQIDGISIRVGAGEISAYVGGIGRVVRRMEFDAVLASLARETGVTVVEDMRVTSISRQKHGAHVETSRGTLDAAVVVGADGVGSVVRRLMELTRDMFRAQVLEVDTEPIAGDRDRGFIHFDGSDRSYPGYSWDFPTEVGGEPMVSRGIYRLRMGDEQVDLTAVLGKRLAAMRLDLARYKKKRYAERGCEPTGTFSQGALMLIGEAAGIDPITGEGIAQAIEYGDLAAQFLVRHLEHDTSLSMWRRTLRCSRWGRDPRVRGRGVTAFYANSRSHMERPLCQLLGVSALRRYPHR